LSAAARTIEHMFAQQQPQGDPGVTLCTESGAVAQLVERLDGIQEVARSTRVSSTTQTGFTLAGYVAGEGSFVVTSRNKVHLDGSPMLRFVFLIQVQSSDVNMARGSPPRPRRRRLHQPRETTESTLAADEHALDHVDQESRRGDDPILRGIPPSLRETRSVRTVARPDVGLRRSTPRSFSVWTLDVFGRGLRKDGSWTRSMSAALLRDHRLLRARSLVGSRPRKAASLVQDDASASPWPSALSTRVFAILRSEFSASEP
jgi:hypothetical protein